MLRSVCSNKLSRLGTGFFLVLAVVSTACRAARDSRAEDHESIVDQPTATETPEPKTVFTDGEVKVENVTFGFDRELIESVEFSELPAFKLEEDDIKPDAVGGRVLQFELKYRGSDDVGYVSVFKLAEYKEAFASFPQYLEKRDEDLKSLINKPASLKRFGIEEPVHVRWMDAHHDFYAKAGIVSFRGGRGVLMLTQISQDDYIVNNGRLEYFFQGITDDGIYFVEIELPADMRGLPTDGGIEAARRYGLPDDFYLPKYDRPLRDYRTKIVKEIELSPDSAFLPPPARIRAFLSSFTVE